MKKLIAEEKKKHRRGLPAWAATVAAVLALLVALPNVSMAAAETLGALPVVGGLFRVVTIRTWQTETDTLSARVELPAVLSDSYPIAAEEINRQVAAMEAEAMQWLQDAEGVAALDIRSQVLTDDPDWFSLQVTVFRAQGGGWEQRRIFTVSKAAGRLVQLRDVLTEQGLALAEENLRAMMAADDRFFVQEFVGFKDGQDFYLTEEGDLVLAFDEYEIASGDVGAPEFTLPAQLIAPYLQMG